MASIPKNCQRLVVQKLTSNFREAVSVETVDMCHPQKGEICIKNKYVGINAADVNLTKGRYFVKRDPPFLVGFEGVGEVVEIGEGVEDLKVGQAVSYLCVHYNAYADYLCIKSVDTFIVPEAKPEYVALIVSGLTVAIGLDKSARISAGDTVLITAAAGGTGHIAVQWAKAADCHVIGTCSSEEKVNFLKELGCDRVINYKKEDLGRVLAKEYPQGIDVIWETIGGKVFEDCVKNLALKGRLIVVGGISGYKEETKEAFLKVDVASLPEQLLFKSAAVQGFLLPNFAECFSSYFKNLNESFESGKLRIVPNLGKATGSEFQGLEGIIKGVEYLHSGKSIGKVTVKMN